MVRGYYRTVKNNQIHLLGKVLSNKDLSGGQLDGQRFYFMPYFGETGFTKDGLTALWGTERLSKAIGKANKENLSGEQLATFLKPSQVEDSKILTPDGFFRWYFWKIIDAPDSN